MKITIVILLIILFSCKQERASRDTSHVDSTQNVEIDFTLPNLSESEFIELFDLQRQVNNNPDIIELRKQLISKSYFVDKKILITFGCARKTNPQTGQSISQVLLKRAALLDAKRWAVYGETWIKNNYMPSFGKLNSNYNGIYQNIFSFNHGDSLVLAFAHKIN